METCFLKFVYLCCFRLYKRGDGIIRLLGTKSDELKPVFFQGMTVYRGIFTGVF
jgi:hypothetical protein